MFPFTLKKNYHFLFFFFLTFVKFFFSPSGEDSGLDELSTDGRALDGTVKYNMRKSLDLEHEGCYLQAGKKDCLQECGFNATAKTIFIIHGWTVRELELL